MLTNYTEMVGKRIRFKKHSETDFLQLTPGEKGTVIDANESQIHVCWDSGSRLIIRPGLDEYEILRDTETRKTT
jgi:hypothetical protein